MKKFISGLTLFSGISLLKSTNDKNKIKCDEKENDYLCAKAAICVLNPSKNYEAKGLVLFNQASYTSPTIIKGTFENLKPNAKHGFHIHTYGDSTDGCMSAGPHYNPFTKTHGGLYDDERHVGDLGNVESDENCKATFKAEVSSVHLIGKYSVIGRTLVLHADEDDLGRGNFPDSKITGHAGLRIACGIIGLADENKYKL
jgi:Cu-Zn family superoxide dismutase